MFLTYNLHHCSWVKQIQIITQYLTNTIFMYIKLKRKTWNHVRMTYYPLVRDIFSIVILSIFYALRRIINTITEFFLLRALGTFKMYFLFYIYKTQYNIYNSTLDSFQHNVLRLYQLFHVLKLVIQHLDFLSSQKLSILRLDSMEKIPRYILMLPNFVFFLLQGILFLTKLCII